MTVVLLWEEMPVCLQLLIGALNDCSLLLVFWDNLSHLKCACVVCVFGGAGNEMPFTVFWLCDEVALRVSKGQSTKPFCISLYRFQIQIKSNLQITCAKLYPRADGNRWDWSLFFFLVLCMDLSWRNRSADCKEKRTTCSHVWRRTRRTPTSWWRSTRQLWLRFLTDCCLPSHITALKILLQNNMTVCVYVCRLRGTWLRSPTCRLSWRTPQRRSRRFKIRYCDTAQTATSCTKPRSGPQWQQRQYDSPKEHRSSQIFI